MASNNSVNVPITVNLTQPVFQIMQEANKDIPLATALSNKATVFFDNLANGGMMLTPDQIKKIEQVYKKPIDRGADVVAAVQAGSSIEDDSRVRKWKLDPVYDEPLEEAARNAGRSVDELLSDMMNMAIENNWIFGFVPQNGPVFLTEADLRYWQQATGKQKPTGADMTEAVKKMTQVVAA